MRPTLINLDQVDIVEKTTAGFDAPDILAHDVVHLVDKHTGQPIVDQKTGKPSTIAYEWDARYAKPSSPFSMPSCCPNRSSWSLRSNRMPRSCPSTVD